MWNMELNRSKSMIVALMLTMMPSMTEAQENVAPKIMTLHDCMEYAVSNSTKMRIEAADRNDEQWQRRQSIMAVFTPHVKAETYAYNQYGRNLDPETNTYNDVTTFYNGYNANAGFTLFDGFQSVNNMRMAKTAAKMGISKEMQTRDEICLATMEAYYNVIYYTKLEAVIAEQVATAQTSHEKAKRQEELGQKSHADVVQMESELAKKEYQLTNARNQKEQATLTLKDVMFWPVRDELVIDHNISEPLLNEVEALELSESAKQILPSAAIATLNRRKATLDLKSARGAYSPTLSFYAGWSTTYYTYPGKEGYKAIPFGEQFRNNRGEYIQLSLSFTIFDQLRRRTTIQNKKNALRRAEAEYDQKMRDIENEVVRAVSDRDGAQAAYRQADRLAAVEQEAFQLSSKQYETGLISAIEYQTASQSYLNAMAERMNSLLKLRLKDAVVRYYNGEAYISQN